MGLHKLNKSNTKCNRHGTFKTVQPMRFEIIIFDY